MTRLAAKKSHVGRKRQPGRVVRSAGGIVQMIEFTEYVSNPSAPSVLVNKVAGIYRLESIIKCTFALQSQTLGGAMRTVEAASMMWTDEHAWLEAADLFKWATAEIRKGTFHGAMPDDGGGRRARTQ